MFGLAALAALMAMAFVGASSAMAEGNTSLCTVDGATCASPITHVHEESVGHALLKSSFATVECEVLFLGDALNSGVSNPLVIHGTFTYNCLNGCTAEEEFGPAEIKILRLGTELADVTGEGLVHVECGLDSTYNGVGLAGHAKGALVATNKLGEVVITAATTNKESGLFCPSTSKLTITTAPLSATYVANGGGGGEEEKVLLSIAPSAFKYTKVKEIKTFTITVDGGTKKAVIQDVKVSAPWKIISLDGGFPHCLGFKLEPATPSCTEEVELTKYQAGLNGKLEVESTTGLTKSATLTT
jgi:hypothetical protein